MCRKELQPLILVTLLGTLGGCTEEEGGLPDLPVVSETEWSTLHTGEFYRNVICQGDRDRIDALIEEVAASLQIGLIEKVDVSIVDLGTAQSHCDGADGCYKTGSRRVVSSTFALSHEIAHAVIHQEFDAPPTFIDEGLAEAFSTPARRGSESLPKLITEDLYPRDSTQQHFARWVLDQDDSVFLARQLLAGADAEDVFGVTLTELEHLYTTTSPDLYMIDDYCEGTEIPNVSEDERSETLYIDCDDPEVRGLLTPGISGVPTARRTLTLDQPGKYTLSVTGEGALAVALIGCPREGDPIPSTPGSYDHAVYAGMWGGFAGELIPAGESRTLDLIAMRHRVVVSTAAEGLEISLSVRRVPE